MTPLQNPGDRFELPDGSAFEIVTPAAQAGGDYVEMIFTVAPGSDTSPPPHAHPAQVEEYEVMKGQLEVMVDGVWQTLSAGERASVPVGLPHTFRNTSTTTTIARNWHRPALGFQAFLGEAEQIAESPKFKGMKHPSTAVRMSMLYHRYPDTIVATGAMRPLMAMLARLGKLLRLTPY